MITKAERGGILKMDQHGAIVNLKLLCLQCSSVNGHARQFLLGRNANNRICVGDSISIESQVVLVGAIVCNTAAGSNHLWNVTFPNPVKVE